MKKLIALVLVCLLLCGSALAAEWPAGRSAAQPYSGKAPVDLEKTMGYIMLYPHEKTRTHMPAEGFCDRVSVYLPREDVELGTGFVRLMEIDPNARGKQKGVEVCSVDIGDGVNGRIRPMTEAELELFMWGGGVVVETRLPKSLEFGDHSYYITMDEGCFTAANGKVKNLPITKPDAWVPMVEGDYGVSGLYYTEAPADEPTPEPEPTEAPEGEAEEENDFGGSFEVNADGTVKESESAPAAPAKATGKAAGGKEVYLAAPKAGDRVVFDLVMGGEASYAVVFSDNGSVEFDTLEFTGNARVTGKVIRDDINWGIAFLREDSTVLERMDFVP
ncbi:MAG: hypothetical protein IJJ45_05405 [Clostridia bacterium]|nr:hypothetical protein [Clostridia bacterium]